MWLAAFVLNFLEDMANARTISLRYIQNLNRIGNKFVIRTETKRRTRMEFELQSSLYPMPNSKGQFFRYCTNFFSLNSHFYQSYFSTNLCADRLQRQATTEQLAVLSNGAVSSASFSAFTFPSATELFARILLSRWTSASLSACQSIDLFLLYVHRWSHPLMQHEQQESSFGHSNNDGRAPMPFVAKIFRFYLNSLFGQIYCLKMIF